MKKHLYTLIIVLSIISSCKHKSSDKQINTSNSSLAAEPADFASFFTKFKTDSVYQVAHVKFPLRKATTNDDGNSETVDYIKKDQWRYTTFENQKDQIFNKAKVSKTKASVQYMVKDTGISIQFIFLFDMVNGN